MNGAQWVGVILGIWLAGLTVTVVVLYIAGVRREHRHEHELVDEVDRWLKDRPS